MSNPQTTATAKQASYSAPGYPDQRAAERLRHYADNLLELIHQYERMDYSGPADDGSVDRARAAAKQCEAAAVEQEGDPGYAYLAAHLRHDEACSEARGAYRALRDLGRGVRGFGEMWGTGSP